MPAKSRFTMAISAAHGRKRQRGAAQLRQACRRAVLVWAIPLRYCRQTPPALYELQFAVPLAGAVLNTVNTRLEASTIADILQHSDSKLVIADTHLAPLLRAAFALNGNVLPVIDIIDHQAGGLPGFGQSDLESLATRPEMANWDLPADEWQALALNYTSGTSGRPKGVIYHHRGAYLMTAPPKAKLLFAATP